MKRVQYVVALLATLTPALATPEPVPEPATIGAAALLALPIGLGIYRALRKK